MYDRNIKIDVISYYLIIYQNYVKNLETFSLFFSRSMNIYLSRKQQHNLASIFKHPWTEFKTKSNEVKATRIYFLLVASFSRFREFSKKVSRRETSRVFETKGWETKGRERRRRRNRVKQIATRKRNLDFVASCNEDSLIKTAGRQRRVDTRDESN